MIGETVALVAGTFVLGGGAGAALALGWAGRQLEDHAMKIDCLVKAGHLLADGQEVTTGVLSKVIERVDALEAAEKPADHTAEIIGIKTAVRLQNHVMVTLANLVKGLDERITALDETAENTKAPATGADMEELRAEVNARMDAVESAAHDTADDALRIAENARRRVGEFAKQLKDTAPATKPKPRKKAAA